ncbi:MAG: sodium:solute symporter family protein [Thermoanaerobacteraceae bacterium]|nr:sodium:solute symporter family protein [Thermoanaerobacteraceae bacterium]
MGNFGIGTGGMIFLFIMLALMLYLGYYSFKQRSGESMSDYFLANRGVGTMVLAFSLFATQYSGNSMIGYTARAYRIGFSQLVYPIFMVMIVVFYLLFIPRLFALAHKYNYITVVDYLNDRYNSKLLSLIGGIFLLWGIVVQFLEQLQATGTLFAGVSPNTPYWVGVVFLGAVITIYVMIGGMRGAMLVQALQGAIMFFGVLFLLIFGWAYFGSIGSAVQTLAASEPAKVLPPVSLSKILNWASTMILVGLGASLYVSSIQQFYASQSEKVVKRSLTRMAVLTFITPTILVLVGIMCAAAFPGLSEMESERVVPYMINAIMQKSPIAYWAMTISFTGIIMATLSTASGTLISITSMLIKDFYKGFINPNVSDSKATTISRWFNLVVIVIGILLVLEPSTTIWRLTEIKFEGLVQVAPAIILGLYWQKASKASILSGMIAGGVLAIGMNLAGHASYMGIQAGMWGLILNFIIVIILSNVLQPSSEEIKNNEERFVSVFRVAEENK